MMRSYALPALLVLAFCPLEAAVITVTTTDDIVAEDGLCSLREAIVNANHADQSGSIDCLAGGSAGNVIQLDPALIGGTITLGGEHLQISFRDLVIEGPVAGDADGLILNGNQASQVVQVLGPGTHAEVTLRDLTLTGGRTSDSSRPGGALHAQSVSLTLDNVTVAGNSTGGNSSSGGGVSGLQASVELIDSTIEGNYTEGIGAHGGGMFMRQSDVTLIRSQVLNNHVQGAGSNGGGVWVGPFGLNPSNLELTDSLIAGNSTQHSTTFGGGIWLEADETVITSSTISGNSVTAGGGGLSVRGGTFTMINSTVSGNSSSAAGGGMQIRSIDASLVHSTVAFNWASSNNTRDIRVFGTSDEPASLELINSLVVQEDSSRGTCSASDFATITASGTLSTHEGCTGAATAPENIKLMALADNGGLVRTHALGIESEAVGVAGDCAGDFGIDSDQRGEQRPGASSDFCDAGAYEFQGVNVDRILHDRFEP